MEIRDFDTAQHEAAHVVVGCALGLRLRAAVVRWHQDRDDPSTWLGGYAWFHGHETRDRAALALMLAAGIAWERAIRGKPRVRGADAEALRGYCGSRREYEAYITAAGAMLAGRQAAHARVTRALLDRDITGADIAAICRGETLE